MFGFAKNIQSSISHSKDNKVKLADSFKGKVTFYVTFKVWTSRSKL